MTFFGLLITLLRNTIKLSVITDVAFSKVEYGGPYSSLWYDIDRIFSLLFAADALISFKGNDRLPKGPLITVAYWTFNNKILFCKFLLA